jgi:hypothetical protein
MATLEYIRVKVRAYKSKGKDTRAIIVVIGKITIMVITIRYK